MRISDWISDVCSSDLAIVENIPVGVCLFDGDLSLVAFNSEYAKLLDIPRSLLESGATFQDLVRFNAERGEYGGRPIDKEIESRTQMLLTSLEGRVERVRPNGTVLENRNRRLPSGRSVRVRSEERPEGNRGVRQGRYGGV